MVKLGRNHPLVKYVTKQNRCATCISRTNIAPVPTPLTCQEKIVNGGTFTSNIELERLRGSNCSLNNLYNLLFFINIL